MSRLHSPRLWLVLIGAGAVLSVTTAVVLIGAVAGLDRGIESLLFTAFATLAGAGWLKAYLQHRRAQRAEQALATARQATAAAALRDQVTGLANQRLFDSHLRAAFERAQRYGNPFSVLLIEVNLPAAQPHTSHGAGNDRLLRYLSSVISHSLRSTDIAARINDFAFGIVLPETEYEGARRTWERLREAALASWPENRAWSLSGGAAGYTVDVGSVESMLSDADRRLALEKRRLRAEHES